MPQVPELISNISWLLTNPADLSGLRGDIWAWASVPHTKAALYELLSVLKKHDASATFFMSGVCARQNSEAVRAIVRAGHEMGLHGYKHVPYNMPSGEVRWDMYRAIGVFKELGVAVSGFRAPWLIANQETYLAAQKFGLTYVSNVKAKRGIERLDEYGLLELPIYADDESLLAENAVEALLQSADAGRVFEFHLLYTRRSVQILDEFLEKLPIEAATLSQVAEGHKALGLSIDVAYLDRLELLRKLFS